MGLGAMAGPVIGLFIGSFRGCSIDKIALA
jgi:hypothetical protein